MRRVLDWVVCLAALALIAVILWWGWDYARARPACSRWPAWNRSRCSGATWRCRSARLFCVLGIVGNLLDPQRHELETAQ